MARYSQDPRWITARFASKCRKCDTLIRKGEPIFYYPRSKTALGSVGCGCGTEASNEFDASAADEDLGRRPVHRSGRVVVERRNQQAQDEAGRDQTLAAM